MGISSGHDESRPVRGFLLVAAVVCFCVAAGAVVLLQAMAAHRVKILEGYGMTVESWEGMFGKGVSFAGRRWLAAPVSLRISASVLPPPDLRVLNALRASPMLEKVIFEGRDMVVPAALLQAVVRLPRLTELRLSSVVLDAPGWECVRSVDGLEVLMMFDTDLTDARLAQLACLPRLKTLILSNVKVTRASLPLLGGLTGLKTLLLDGTGIPKSDQAALAASLPGAGVRILGGTVRPARRSPSAR